MTFRTLAWPVVLIAASAGAQTPELEVCVPRAGQYEKVEFVLRPGVPVVRPFDPDEADFRLEVRTPSGRTISVPAFFLQPYERAAAKEQGGPPADWYYPAGEAGWRARFSGSETGRHSAVARFRDRAGERVSAPVSFEIAPSARHGFLRVSKRDPRFFEFDDGTPFFAIGQDLAFIGPGQAVTPLKAREILRRMGGNGANYARVWTCCDDWAIALESRKSAWGRSWAGKPPLEPAPDDPDRRCVRLEGGGAARTVEPSHPVFLRAGTRYALVGRWRAEGDATLVLERNGRTLGEPVAADPSRPWTDFRREFDASPGEWRLGALRVRAAGSGTGRLDGLSLREAAGGPDLLWEADPNREVSGNFNQADAFLLDEVVEAAAAHGVHLQLCLLTRNLYMDRLKDPATPAYDAAIRDAKRLLRYAVARWGHATAVASWEYWNEQNPGLPTDRFYAELGRYLEQTDPWRHLRATSAWGPAPKDWAHPQLDVADLHWYLRPNWNELWKDAAAAASDRAAFLRARAPGRPALLSEFGLADEKWGLSPYMRQDRDLLHFHDALWASSVSGLSGTAMFWWWEQLDRMDAYPHYRPVAAFTEGIPYTTGRLRSVSPSVEPARVRAWGLQGADCAFLWFSDAEAAWWRVVVEKAAPTAVGNAEAWIDGLAPGTYVVQWWDTYAGRPLREDRAAAPDGRLRLAPPDFTRDIACKAVLQPAERTR